MASGVLASRNESNWGDRRGGYMSGFSGRFPYNKTPNFPSYNTITGASSNPSHFISGNSPSGAVLWQNYERLQTSAQPPAAAAPSTGALFDPVPENSFCRRYVTFRLASYTRRELKELKYRLIMDLERVRSLRQRISSPSMIRSKECCHEEPPFQPGNGVQYAKIATMESKGEKSIGKKRATPSSSAGRETKKRCGGVVKNNTQKHKVLMRKCGQILDTLMKHKHGWVFNAPVDAVSLGLHDYHNIIKTPMDLGTIKSKLAKNGYRSPPALASDVRLTFQNAKIYNGRGSEVFDMAELLLSMFEDMYTKATQKFALNKAKQQNRAVKVPVVIKRPASVMPKSWNLMAARKAADLGKEMAMEVTKGEMKMEDKLQLAKSLENLQVGPEGMEQILAITQKKGSGLAHKGNEIELDILDLDNETLWELHSFVASYHKKAAANAKMTEGSITYLDSPVHADNSLVSGPPQEEEGKKRNAGEEEDIDIGEEIPVTNFPSVWIEKDAVGISSSSSSSSSSGSDSSSSDSDSGRSSGDDSDEEGTRSPPKGD